EGQGVAAGAAHQHYLGAEVEHLGGRRSGLFGEGDKQQVELNGAAAHQVVHAHGAAVGEREGKEGAGHQNGRFAAGGASRGAPGKDADAAIGEGQEEGFGIRCRRARSAAEGDAGGASERAFAQVQAAQRLRPQSAEHFRVAGGASHEAQVVDLQNVGELLLRVVARGGGAMAVFHHRARHVHGGPSALPRAIAQVEIFDVGGVVDLIDIAERAQFGGVVERAAPAAVEHVAAVFARQGLVAAHREVFGRTLREHRLAGLLAAHAGGKADLRGGAEKAGDLVERSLQRGKKTGLEQHVVVEQADVRAAGAFHAAVDGAGEGERGGGGDDFDLRGGGGEPLGGAVGAAVIHYHDLLGRLCQQAGKLGLQQIFASARRDDNGDARVGLTD